MGNMSCHFRPVKQQQRLISPQLLRIIVAELEGRVCIDVVLCQSFNAKGSKPFSLSQSLHFVLS